MFYIFIVQPRPTLYVHFPPCAIPVCQTDMEPEYKYAFLVDLALETVQPAVPGSLHELFLPSVMFTFTAGEKKIAPSLLTLQGPDGRLFAHAAAHPHHYYHAI